MNATTTPEAAAAAATPARGAAKDYDAALAYLGGALMDALKADGFSVSVRNRTVIVTYLQTQMVLAEVAIKGNTNETGYIVAVRWNAGISRRPGLYDIDANTNRINTAGFLAAMHRETKRFADDLVAEQRRHAAEAEADRIREANKPVADALNKLYGVPTPEDDGQGGLRMKYVIPFLRGGDVAPADHAEGYVEFMLQPTMVRTTPELARRLFSGSMTTPTSRPAMLSSTTGTSSRVAARRPPPGRCTPSPAICARTPRVAAERLDRTRWPGVLGQGVPSSATAEKG